MASRNGPATVLCGILWVWGLTPVVGAWLWMGDILANLVPWAIPLGLALAIRAALRRRPAMLVFALAPLLLVAIWMSTGRARRDPDAEPDIRVLHFNALTERDSPDAALALLLETRADVVAITEAPRTLLDRIRTDPDLARRFPHRDLPPWDLTHTRLILSRMPLEPLIDRASLAQGDSRRALRLVRVTHEAGSFVVLSVQPRSPRTPARWREGNALLGVAISALRERAGGEPVVVLADLNSTPTGSRSRLLWDEAGLRRCKPLVYPAGTYPSALPWPFSLAIDDAWVSRHWRVATWRTIGGIGSDHRAVEVGLVRTSE